MAWSASGSCGSFACRIPNAAAALLRSPASSAASARASSRPSNPAGGSADWRRFFSPIARCRFVHGLAPGHRRVAPAGSAMPRTPGPALWGRGAAPRARSRPRRAGAAEQKSGSLIKSLARIGPLWLACCTLPFPFARSPDGRSPAAPQRARETARHRRIAPPLPRRAPVRPGRDHADLQPDRPHHCRRCDAGRPRACFRAGPRKEVRGRELSRAPRARRDQHRRDRG